MTDMQLVWILITGANGFLGSALCKNLDRRGMRVRAAVRKSYAALQGVEPFLLSGFDDSAGWRAALEGVDVVVHAAARAHVMQEKLADPLAEYRRVNVQGTANLARQAAQAGVRRFVFISSIGVNGNCTDRPFTEADSPQPNDDYAISKYEAEQALWQVARDTGMEVVIIRPPLVYGPRAPGNFGALVRAVARGWPLPLGAVTSNRRSLIAIDNLVDLIVTCLDHPAAANQTFLVSDGEDLSTADLLRRLGEAMGRPVRLFSMPPALLQAGARLLGKGIVVRRLLGNLQVDIAHTRQTLGWTPPISVDEGLRRAVGAAVPDPITR